MAERFETTSATRAALEKAEPGARVLGWVDITSPNLVDLLDELTSISPEGLEGFHWRFVSGFGNDICVVRGLRTLADYGIALKVEGTVSSAEVQRLVPALRVIEAS